MIAKTGMQQGDIWVIEEPGTASHGRTYYCIDTAAGAASWVMTSSGILSGAEVSWNADTGVVNIGGASKVTIESGGELNLAGNNAVTIGTGGSLNMVGSEINIHSGGKLKLSSADNLMINSNTSISTYVSSEIISVRIGGQNLVRKSDFTADQTSNDWLAWGTTALTHFPAYRSIRVSSSTGDTTGICTPPLTVIPKAGDVWTVSFDAGSRLAVELDYCFILNTEVGNKNILSLGGVSPALVAGQYAFRRYSFTVTFDSDYTTPIRLLLGMTEQPQTTNILFRDIQVQAGNKSTAWAPAPEDMADRVSQAETRITQTEHDITLKAS